MKTIGLLGGMSWESTAAYYRIINEKVNQHLGGLNSAKIILHSVNFEPVEQLMQKGDWQGIASIISSAAKSLEKGGADFFLICTNTMHKLAEEIEESVNIPLIHIADATAEVLVQKNIKKAGLLGTSFTMEQDFYTKRMRLKHGIDVLIPESEDRKIVHDVIFKELCIGKAVDSSRQEYIRIINDLSDHGAEGVILGCTEIPLLVAQADVSTLLIDTMKIHAEKAAQLAMADQFI